MWESWTPILLGPTVLIAATAASSAFSRERETGSWDHIKPSLLSPGELVAAKLAVPLSQAFLWTLPIWLMLMECVDINADNKHYRSFGAPCGAGAWELPHNNDDNSRATTVGLICSWLSRKHVTAVIATFVCLALIFMIIPYGSHHAFAYQGDFRASIELIRAPLISLETISRKPGRESYLPVAEYEIVLVYLYFCAALAVSGGGLRFLHQKMRHDLKSVLNG